MVDFEPGRPVLDRESFERLLEAHHRRARQLHRALSLVVLHISNLNAIADRAGLGAAAELVARVEDRIRSALRRGDPRARLAFDRIAILVPGCALQDLSALARRVRQVVEGERFTLSTGRVAVELHLGMAACEPHHDGHSPRWLMHSAQAAVDRALTEPDRMFVAPAA